MNTFWIHTPPDSVLMQKTGWADLGGKHYAAIRHHLLVRMGTDGQPRNGPIHKQMEWPVDAELKTEDKITIVAKYTVTLQEAITSAFSATLSHEVLTKIGSAFDAGIDKLSASLKSEVETRLGTALMSSLQETVSSTRTFSYETIAEKSESMTFKVPPPNAGPATRTVYCYVKMRRLFWDVYLYRTDVLRLEYRKSFLWRDIRKTMTPSELELRAPLFRLSYFQPEPALSYAFDSYAPDDEEFDAVTISPTDTSPKRCRLPAIKSLSSLAKIAFPASRGEKRAAKELIDKIRASVAGARVPATGMLRAQKSRAQVKREAIKSHKVTMKSQRTPAALNKRSGTTTKRKSVRTGTTARRAVRK